ncbi:glycosyltransferase family 4 protein [Ferruginibacter sp.]
MKIVINCWILRNKNLDGIGYFTINTVRRIIQNNPEVSFVLLCDKNFTEPYFNFSNAEIKRVFPPYRHPLLYVFYMELVLPFVLKKQQPDLFFSLDGFLSLCSSCRQLPVMHDLNFEHYPENLAFRNRVYYRFFFKRFAKKAARIATISEYSKADISKLYHIPAEKIDNVSCGINSSLHVLNEEEKKASRARYSEGKPYFFFVGSMHPRKNMLRLIQGFTEFKKNTGSDLKLVIAGAALWDQSALQEVYTTSAYKSDIHFAGRLSDDELKSALGAAYALSFVPVFEGFGLPVVEAFEAGVPVLASNVTSLPEVAGDAAVYADPFNVQDIAKGMQLLYENKDGLCPSLIQKGFEQKKKFSWDATAAMLWQTILKASKK